MNSLPWSDAVLALDGKRPLQRELVGGKAYSLNQMRRLGLPVPPAFVLATSMCAAYHDHGGKLPAGVWDAVLEQLARLEEETGRRFGGPGSPLLVSVRSGAAASMPGMMDTVLNLGITPRLRDVLATESGDATWAADTWERFRRCYGEIVLADPDAAPPADPYDQLRAAIGAVFASWHNDRVRAYRARHRLGEGSGTAVTIQAMVFGNRGPESGTGVLFSRDPGTGEPRLFGEWLPCAQGDDVVSGAATPEPLSTLAERMPGVHSRLAEITTTVEADLRDLADIEFTIDSGRLYILQSRAGKRSAAAAVRIAVDLAREGVIDPATAVSRVSREQAESLAATAGVDADGDAVAAGLGASPGIATGVAVSDVDQAMELASAGTPVVLVRPTTAPEDVPAMFDAVAVVTDLGGSTSHAALVCREIGLPCVVGCGTGTSQKLAGRTVTVDGNTGQIYEGDATTAGRAGGLDPYVAALLQFAGVSPGADMPDAEHPLAPFVSRLSL
jgi:pyruvate, orthophosphate dikinase